MNLAKCANHNLEECTICGTYVVVSPRVAKQVIVMRTDLNMRKGKMVAQGAHASLAAVWMIDVDHCAASPVYDYDAYRSWRNGTFTKICVSVDSVNALLEVHAAAHEAGLPVTMIIDSGATEFHGVATYTCLAIGPAWAEDIDKITGKLRLL